MMTDQVWIKDERIQRALGHHEVITTPDGIHKLTGSQLEAGMIAVAAIVAEDVGILRAYDAGDDERLRYVVLRTDWVNRNGLVDAVAMSGALYEHSTASDGPHLGERISFLDLPKSCQYTARHFIPRPK